MACFTEAFRPWMSDTTAMIDVTATILPSTVMNDRSFADQMASSAMRADSRSLFIRGRGRQGGQGRQGLVHPAFPGRPRPPCLPLRLVVHLHQIAVGHAAHRIVRSGDDLIAGCES